MERTVRRGTATIAGKAITLDDESYTVVGVLPADFQFGSTAADFQARGQVDIWFRSRSILRS